METEKTKWSFDNTNRHLTYQRSLVVSVLHRHRRKMNEEDDKKKREKNFETRIM